MPVILENLKGTEILLDADDPVIERRGNRILSYTFHVRVNTSREKKIFAKSVMSYSIESGLPKMEYLLDKLKEIGVGKSLLKKCRAENDRNKLWGNYLYTLYCVGPQAKYFNLDSAVDSNKNRHSFLTILQGLANRKSSHELQKGEGRGYVFNNDGNQTSYCYDIDRIQTIDYDRNKVRAMVKELNRAADEMSIKIDEALLQTKVEYAPKFDLAGESEFILEELMER